MLMKSKNAVVIGGSSDIGDGIVGMLEGKKYNIIATYNSNEKFKTKNVEWYKINLLNKCELYNFIEIVKKTFKKIDVLIYNAGITCRKKIKDTTDNDIENVFNINVFNAYIIIRELYDFLDNNAKIIVTGSQMGINPHSMSSLYGMSKSCLHAMVKNLVKEFDGNNITINAIVPGFVDTNWQKDKTLEIRKNICKKTALHRFAKIEEIVKGFEFCIENDFVNGSLIEINGGYCYE